MLVTAYVHVFVVAGPALLVDVPIRDRNITGKCILLEFFLLDSSILLNFLKNLLIIVLLQFFPLNFLYDNVCRANRLARWAMNRALIRAKLGANIH